MSQNSPNPRRVEQPTRFDRAAFNPDRTRHMGELVIACVLLVATFPLMLVVALAIKLESPGPVLDRCDCVGRGNRGFQMLKFRTAYIQGGSRGSAAQLTRIGGFLRYTRIDALPQLFNVLRNEMSIIDTGAHAPVLSRLTAGSNGVRSKTEPPQDSGLSCHSKNVTTARRRWVAH